MNKYVIEFLTSGNPLLPWVKDAIEYGLRRYVSEFGTVNYGTPFFNLYSEYSMRDTAPLTNYEKTHSSFRGQGLITAVKSDYLLFVDLYKKEGIKNSVNYDDRFLSPQVFQWQSPNSTKQDSDIGNNLIHNKDNKVNLHLFVRKYPSLENITAPFIYLGKVNTIDGTAKGDKPITMNFLLENEVPDQLYNELITIVDGDSDETED